MFVSKETDYGLRTMIGVASNASDLMTEKEIAQVFHIPVNFLSLILPKLVRGKLLDVVQEPKKKPMYKLARAPKDVTVLQIMEAVNGAVDLVVLNEKHKSELSEFGTMMGIWTGLTKSIESYLSQVTLDKHLIKKAK
jgi:Rrf2 family protein